VALAVDGAGKLYIADAANYRIRGVSPDGVITTLAGTGGYIFSSEGDIATNTQISAQGVAVDGAGNIYVADMLNGRIRKFSPGGSMLTAAGPGRCCYGGDDGPAVRAQLNLFPWGGGMSVDSGGNLFIADAANLRVRKIDVDGAITTVAGSGLPIGFSGDGEAATSAQLSYPTGVAADTTGNLYIADTNNLRVRKVDPRGIITTVAGGRGADGIAARAVLADAAGNVYVAAGCLGRVRRISKDGGITTVAGGGTGELGDGGPANDAQLGCVWSLALDTGGNLYFSDIDQHRVRRVSTDGIITTVAGDGTAGYAGDGGAAAGAELNAPAALAMDRGGNLFIADTFNRRIRMVSPAGIITTVAGDGAMGYAGDGGPATAARFGLISGMTSDDAGNLYIADQTHNSVRLLRRISAQEQ
jgi:sugar lactone lactonase YvrE